MKNILRVKNIHLSRSKSFRLDIEKIKVSGGDILCVAGPNGSGKTTFIECLVGLLTAPSVDITMNGLKIGRNLLTAKTIVGYVPDDESWFIKELCAKEYFDLLLRTYADVDIPVEKMKYRIQEFARQLHFKDFSQPLLHLSHGNKKKVQLIAGLMHEPKLIVIDELRNGLDPLAIVTAEQIIRAEAYRGACIVAATHDLWWAERIATDTLLLMDGKVALYEKTDDLLAEHNSLEKLFIQLAAREDFEHAAV